MIAVILIPLLICIFVIGYLVVARFDKFMQINSENKRKQRKNFHSDIHNDKKR